jgi:hypothetical protein
MALKKSKRKPTMAQRLAAIKALREILRPKSGVPSAHKSLSSRRAEVWFAN